ncbi:MAG: radical SAM family heme chaperone HemW [Anaerolineales bacterium]|nr:radical SAM family heme chaperone HemW [Anaerolineales bacterium]
MDQPHSVYLHIPFCKHRCAYCDFNTFAGMEKYIPEYLQALTREIEIASLLCPERYPVHSIFFGGGTPSLLPALSLRSLLEKLYLVFEISDNAEISLEANPGTVSRASLGSLRKAGFNRLSLGVQSANPGELRLLERSHNYFDVIRSVNWARQSGFDNLSLDLIYGLPGQTLENWQVSVQRSLALAPEHLSLYALTIESGTLLGCWAAKGYIPIPDPDCAAEMYEWAAGFLEQRGYEHYEISNWAVPGFQCRHNLQYWRNLPYFGFGAGAHGCVGGVRTANESALTRYIRLMKQGAAGDYPAAPAVVERRLIDTKTEMQETMLTGLRLTEEGVSMERFRRRFGIEMREVFGEQIEKLTAVGLLEWVKDRTPDHSEVLRLTRRGHLLGNQVFIHFVE